jgi:outer membrane immunogenic protein
MKSLVTVWAALAAIGVAAPAIAADMPVKAGWVAPPPSWSGCYIGGNAGGGSPNKHYRDPLEPVPVLADLGKHTGSGAVGGGQVGCDLQFGGWVFGIQGMVDGTNIKGEHVLVGEADVFRTTIPWLATATGRIGLTVMQSGLLYVKGGGAWVRDRERIVDLGIVEASADVTRSGWTVGGGLEVLASGNLSFFVEYNYMNFGTRRTNFTDLEVPPGPPFPLDIRQNVQMVVVGANYRFNLGGR